MTNSSNSVTRVIDASTDEIFNLLSNPARHTELDDAGEVESLDQGDRIQKVGDAFTMNMNRDGKEYQTRNEVFAFQENKVIGWQNVENITDEQKTGSKWLYELETDGPDSSRVTLTYDRSEIESDVVLKVSESYQEDALEKSLEALASAVSQA